MNGKGGGEEDEERIISPLKCQEITVSLLKTRETRVRSLGQENPLEKEIVTHSSILAWTIQRTEEPGGLQYSAYKLNKQDDNIQSCSTPFPVWDQSVLCSVLTVAS